jgi:hypothetical protein
MRFISTRRSLNSLRTVPSDPRFSHLVTGVCVIAILGLTGACGRAPDTGAVASPTAPGSEVFSLIRTSSLEPHEYLNRFFDTGSEHQKLSLLASVVLNFQER